VRFLSEFAWILETGVGYISAVIGFLAILAHFSGALVITVVASATAFYAVMLTGATVQAFIYVWRH
jgi:hypothetical protein